MLRVFPPTFEFILSGNKSGCKVFSSWVVALFNSFCCNVAKEVVRFLLAVFPYLKDYLTFTSSQLES